MTTELKTKKKLGCIKIGLIIIGIWLLFSLISVIIGGDENTATIDKTQNNDSITKIETLNENIESNLVELNKSKDLDKFTHNDLMLMITVNNKLVNQGLSTNIDSIMKKSEKLKIEIIKFQESNFPTIRKKYAENLNKKLWEHNIEVKCLNKSCTKLEYIGGAFANNKNIKDAYESMSSDITDLRFKQINFKWIKHDDEYTYYTIESKKDGEY